MGMSPQGPVFYPGLFAMIHLKDLRLSFPGSPGNQPILAVDSWSVAEGESVAILGESGSGKTTLLNVLGGLRLPDSGIVEVAKVDLAGLSEAGRDRHRARNIGILFQTHHLLEGFSARENVELGATFGGRPPDRARVDQLLSALGLKDRLGHQPSELSVGQKARVALARALINRPKVLLADEPTGSLDPARAAQVLELILDTSRKEGITVICATHDPSVGSAMDRSISMEELR